MSKEKGEEWKKIQGFDRYSVSSLGNVRNDTTERMLKPRVSNHGTNRHAKVTLSNGFKSSQLFVHRLVADAFIRPLNSDDLVNHKNDIPTDNRAVNLEICNNSENVRHSLRLRKSIANLRAAIIPLEHQDSKGLIVLRSGQRNDSELLEFFRGQGFRCEKCRSDNEMKRIISDYLTGTRER